MSNNLKTHVPASIGRRSFSITLAAFLLAAPLVLAQAPSSRFVGAITAIGGTTVTVKTDAGDVRQFEVPATAEIKRISPGQTDLSAADVLKFSDLAAGDRVLVKLDPVSPGPPAQALQIVAVKQADLVKKQEQEREDWQKRGVGGLVKSVDPSTGVIVLTSGAGATSKNITVHTTKTTILRRYAPASVRFDEAKPAPIDAIHPGDQLRARGTKNEVGNEITAEEAVSGTFRNISGPILSMDTAASTLLVKDLNTKKLVTIHVTAEAQLRQLQDRVAQMLAARLNGTANGAGGRGGNAHPQNAAPSTNRQGGAGGPAGGGDPQQILNHAQVIQLTDLKKGAAVMVVSTDGTTDVTAITLLAGVEPLLQAPAATQSLLSNWSMGSGGEEGPE